MTKVYLMESDGATVKCITARNIPTKIVDKWLQEHNSKLNFYESRWWIK